MELWKVAKRADAQKLIDWLISTRKDGGWIVDWPNVVALAELGASSSRSDLTQSVIGQVLDRMIQRNGHTIEDFEAAYEELIKANAVVANQQAGLWRFFIPFEVTVSADFPPRSQILILGRQFSFVRLPSVERHMDERNRKVLRNPSLLSLMAGVKVEHASEIFLSVSTLASSWKLAWADIEPAFDALRGLIELSLDFRGMRISTGRTSSRRKVPHPLWMIACKDDTPPEWLSFITDEDTTSKAIDLSNALMASVKKNAKILQRESERQSTLSLIADCLRLYSQAMDARFRHLCLLGFWQLAEAITLAESFGGQTDKVVARLAWHGPVIGLKGSGYKEVLGVLAKKRNSIVHRGIHDVEDNDINIMKLACEAAISWLYRVQKMLPTLAHIEQYYRLREVSQTDRDAIKGCLAYLSKQNGP